MQNDPFYFDVNEIDKIPIFDSHCHLQFSDFDNDRETIISNAKQAGLSHVICVATNYEDAETALQLAEKHHGFIFSTVGNHPYHADKPFSKIKKFALKNRTKIVAIGETGLDYFKSPIPKEIQKKSFRQHCVLASELDLPIIVHLREFTDCYNDAKKIILDTNCKKVIVHSFTGDLKAAEEIWSYNWKTSFSLMLTYPKNEELRKVYKKCPPHLKLHETDAPYLPPQNKRGLRNEPQFIFDCLNI